MTAQQAFLKFAVSEVLIRYPFAPSWIHSRKSLSELDPERMMTGIVSNLGSERNFRSTFFPDVFGRPISKKIIAGSLSLLLVNSFSL